MKLGSHEIEPIVFPGDANGYLSGNSGKPGDLCGYFVPGVQVYQCTRCEEMFQPVDETRCKAPEDPKTAENIRISYGGTTRTLIRNHPLWVCDRRNQ